ncbi:54S ribosomal protein L22 mitochondrial [Spathaspora sp. JA1]|nr:54S ribosomal protein L22 mitochondrial [Spathaspora sp. JA1]
MNRLTFFMRPLVRSQPVGWTTVRTFSRTTPLSSLFGKVTKSSETHEEPPKEVLNAEGEVDPDKITVQNDTDLIKFHKERQTKARISIEKYITPLKLKLFNKVVEKHGFFKNSQVIQHDGKTYKLTLTPKEIELLEPSVYLESTRIKSSMKKATQVNRFVRGFNVKTAINQLHFNPKKMSTELEKLLKQGLEQSKKLGLNEDGMFIHSLWTGSDGDWPWRPDIKGRGRSGIILHRYIHLKCVLKSEQTKKRLDWEKQQKQRAKKPKMFLVNEPLNFSVRPWYKW